MPLTDVIDGQSGKSYHEDGLLYLLFEQWEEMKMNTKRTARLAVTAGLCLSMTLSGLPVEAIAEELVGTGDSPAVDVAPAPEETPVVPEQDVPTEQDATESTQAESEVEAEPEAAADEESTPVPAAEPEASAPAEEQAPAEPAPTVDGYVEDEQGNVEISSVAGLKHFAEVVNGGNKMQGKTVKLTADLDLNNESWEPIGNTEAKSFNGVFDGGNHVISNLLVEGSVNTNAANAYHGLFGCTANGEVKNLTVNNARVTGGLGVGAIVGRPYTSKMTNLTLTGDVQVSGYAYVGGMLGRNAYANLTNLTVNARPGSRVEAQSGNSMTYVGGVVGFMGEGNIAVSNIASNIDVYGSTAGIGGIAGNIHYGNMFSNCSVAEGTEVKMTAANPKYHPFDTMQIGGIAGLWVNAGNTGCAITDCTFGGTLSATSRDNEDYTPVIAGNATAGGPKSEAGTGSLTIVNGGATTVLPGGSSEMQGIFDNIADGATIKLACDVEANVTVPQGVTATIDLAGHTLTAPTGRAILVNGGNLTLMDSTAKAAPVVSEDRESVTYASGKVVATSGVGITVTGGGSLTMESGTVESTNDSGVFVGAQNAGKGTFVMNGGYIRAQEYGIGVIMEGSNATINGGVTMTRDNAALAGNGSKDQSGTDITVSGGTLISHIASKGYIACGIYHPRAGKLTVTGGEIYADGGVGVLMRAGSADITGGTITATGTATGGVGDKSVAVPSSGIVVERLQPKYPGASDSDVVNVSGNVVIKSDESLEVVDVVLPEGEAEKGHVVISGGTFDGKKPNDELLDEGLAFTQDENGSYIVEVAEEHRVAEVDGRGYKTLKEAVDAAKAGQTVKLLKDVTLEGGYADAGAGLELREGITLDGGGHTIDCGSFGKGVRVYGSADAAAKSQFTIKDVVITSKVSYGRCIDTRGGAFDLTLDGVTLKTTGNGNGQPLTIGGSISPVSNIAITNGTNIDAGQAGYGIIVFNPVKMTIDGESHIKGFAALYMKNASSTASGSRGSEVTVTGGATLHGQNVYSGGSNAFAVVVLEDGNISIVLDGAKVIAEAKGSERQAIVSVNRQSGADAGKSTVEIKGDTEVTLDGDAATFMAKHESDADEFLISGGTFTKPVPLEHCAPGYGPVDLGGGKYGVSTEQGYTVQHLFEKVDSDDYEANEELAPTETLTGTIGEQTEAQAKDIKGFVANEISQQAIGADGKTIVEVTYKRTRHTVSFDAMGGTEVAPQSDVKYGAKANEPAAPTKKGCDFVGWYVQGTDEKFDFSQPVTADVALEAHWVRESNHALQHVDAVAPTVDAEGNIEHWFCPDCGAFFADPEGKNEITEEQTVIPKLKVYKVTFDDCLPSTDNPVVEVVEGEPLGKANMPVDPVCEGYKFEGWFYYDADTKEWGERFDPEAPVTGDQFVAAKWSKVATGKPSDKPGAEKPVVPGTGLPQTGDASVAIVAAAGAMGFTSIIASAYMALKRRKQQ